MAAKKVIFVIVEGPSDEEALGVILNRIYDPNIVNIHVTHCDITSKNGVTPKNILSRIGNIVRDYAKLYYYTNKDFKEVIHIIDMDGAFISNDNIIEDGTSTRPFYTTTNIRASNKSSIENRNAIKRSNINRLSGNSTVWGVAYKAFYMSCNLDHVLYNKLNSDNNEKETNSYKFSEKYKDNIPAFLDFISNSEFSVTGEYKDSWEFIKQDLHSLERHTNLGICFNDVEPLK